MLNLFFFLLIKLFTFYYSWVIATTFYSFKQLNILINTHICLNFISLSVICIWQSKTFFSIRIRYQTKIKIIEEFLIVWLVRANICSMPLIGIWKIFILFTNLINPSEWCKRVINISFCTDFHVLLFEKKKISRQIYDKLN